MLYATRIINSLYGRIQSFRYNIKDIRTPRRIVVFESDDWGSIRMSNRKAWEELLRLGYAVDKRPYERYDTLESPDDLVSLFEVLVKHRDSKGKHPILTANMLMVNPDFEKIEHSGFLEYSYEPIAKTYERYYGDARVLKIMKEGINEGVFMPQSHGREHFNVVKWMSGLQAGDEDLMRAFKYGMCGIAPRTCPEKGNQLMYALQAENDKQQKEINNSVTDGLRMFEGLWGFKSKSFVAPGYLWNEQIEQALSLCGVELIQTSRASKPAYKCSTKYFYCGQNNRYGMIYSVRNCTFEPATNKGDAVIDNLISQVENAFAQNKIAVFSTHRINYVGGIEEKNRTISIKILDEFLTELIKNHPDVEFLSSDKLISLYKK